MKAQDAIKLAGGTTALADVFGITASAVCQWRKKGLPKGREWQLRVIKPEWFEAAKTTKPAQSHKKAAV